LSVSFNLFALIPALQDFLFEHSQDKHRVSGDVLGYHGDNLLVPEVGQSKSEEAASNAVSH